MRYYQKILYDIKGNTGYTSQELSVLTGIAIDKLRKIKEDGDKAITLDELEKISVCLKIPLLKLISENEEDINIKGGPVTINIYPQ